MTRSAVPVLLVLLGLFAAFVAWSELAEDGPAPAPDAPPAGAPGGGGRARATPEPFAPPALPFALPPSTEEVPEEEPPAAGADPVQEFLEEALRRVVALLREFGEVEAYLAGERASAFEVVPVEPGIREAVFRMLSGEDRGRRLFAALALARMELSEEELASVRRRFDAELDGLRDGAGKDLVLGLSFALSTHGDAHGLERLADALRTGRGSEVKDFRNGAVMVLGLAEHGESGPLLGDLLASDPDRIVRKHAAQGLGRIGGEASRAALAEALVREQDLEVRAWSALAEGRAAPAGGGDPALLRALAEDPAGEVRGAAAFALSRAGGRGTVSALMENYYRDDHPFARIGSVAGIVARGRGERAREFLASEGAPYLEDLVLESEDDAARYYGAITLGRLPPAEGRGRTLRAVAGEDRSAWVRGAAVSALATAEGRGALPFLEGRLEKEESRFVKERIERVIRRLRRR